MLLEDKTKIFVSHRLQETDKPPVVFMHGDGQNHTIWENLKNYFYHKGHSVLCYDLPGHGLSQPYKEGEYSFSRFTQTLDQIVKEYDIRCPVLVGNSSGGMIALQYAIEHPNEVTGVVAISSCDEDPAKHNADIPGMIENYLNTSRTLFQKQELFDYTKQSLDDEGIFLAAVRNTSPEAVEGNLKALKDFDISSKLHSIRVPVLLIRGSKDLFVTGKWIEKIKDKIRGSRLITIEGYGHHVLLQNPDKIKECVIENYSFLMCTDQDLE